MVLDAGEVAGATRVKNQWRYPDLHTSVDSTKGKLVKKNLTTVVAAVVAVLSLAACGSDSDSSNSSSTNSGSDSYKIAVAQTVTHSSLDASIAGFKQAIADAGLDVSYDDENANNDQTIIASIAGTIAAGDYDLVLGVATPMAQGLAQTVANIPVLFTAVTDPVGAGLVDSLDAPGANITGTTDANPVEEQINLVLDLVPDAKTIGVVYNPGEANSVVQVEWVKEAAEKLGLEVKEANAVTTAEVQQAANSLDVDAIYVPTDNTVVSALDSVIQVGESKKIPVIAAEGDSVANGAVATYGLSYEALGYQTGEMAVKILTEGADPATMAVETQKEPVLYLNLGAAERMGVTIPQDLIDQADPADITQ